MPKGRHKTPARGAQKYANQRKTRRMQVATGRRLKMSEEASLYKEKKGLLKARKRRIEYESVVISTRGREILPAGIVSPFEKPPEDMPQSVQDYFLTSRAIARMGYDPKHAILEIFFTTGYGYHFYSVPQSVWINFKQAASKGRFFMQHIYGQWLGPKGDKTYYPNYTYRRIQ